MPAVERLDERARRACRPDTRRVRPGRAAGRRVGLPVRRVPGVEVIHPLVAAERAARQFVLHDVVVLAVRAVQLPLLVPERVVRESQPGRQFLAVPELDWVLDTPFAEIGNALVLRTEAEVQRQP